MRKPLYNDLESALYSGFCFLIEEVETNFEISVAFKKTRCYIR